MNHNQPPAPPAGFVNDQQLPAPPTPSVAGSGLPQPQPPQPFTKGAPAAPNAPAAPKVAERTPQRVITAVLVSSATGWIPVAHGTLTVSEDDLIGKCLLFMDTENKEYRVRVDAVVAVKSKYK